MSDNSIQALIQNLIKEHLAEVVREEVRKALTSSSAFSDPC